MTRTHSRPRGRRLLPSALLGLLLVLASCSTPGETAGPSASEPPASAAPSGAPSEPAASAAASEPAVTAPPGGEGIDLELVASGFVKPLAVAFHPDGSGDFFVVQQAGLVHYVSGGEAAPDPALDLTGSVLSGGELGMLGIALHPAFEQNGLLYLSYISLAKETILAEYAMADETTIDPSSARELLRLPQENDFHKGGVLVFADDGTLFMSLGDDAWPRGTTPDYTDGFRGSIIRIDVDERTGDKPYGIPEGNAFTPDQGPPEIYDYGLRNPWRMSFDADTGDLYIADVGSERYEEISRHRTGVPAGLDFGWGAWEGFECRRHQIREELDCNEWADAEPPILVIEGGEFASGECAIIGGYVYHGDRVPDMSGKYVFSDFCSGRIRVIPTDEDRPTPEVLLDSEVNPGTFGIDTDGELYLVDVNKGDIWRIVAG